MSATIEQEKQAKQEKDDKDKKGKQEKEEPQVVTLEVNRDGVTVIANPNTPLCYGIIDGAQLRLGSHYAWDMSGSQNGSNPNVTYKALAASVNTDSKMDIRFVRDGKAFVTAVPLPVSKTLLKIWKLPKACVSLFECTVFVRLFVWQTFGPAYRVIEEPKPWCCRIFLTKDGQTFHWAICIDATRDVWLSKMGFTCSYAICSMKQLCNMYKPDDLVDVEYYQPTRTCRYRGCSKDAIIKQKTKASKRCSRCRCTYYCDQFCQQMHWPDHKNDCEEFFVLIQGKAPYSKSPEIRALMA